MTGPLGEHPGAAECALLTWIGDGLIGPVQRVRADARQRFMDQFSPDGADPVAFKSLLDRTRVMAGGLLYPAPGAAAPRPSDVTASIASLRRALPQRSGTVSPLRLTIPDRLADRKPRWARDRRTAGLAATLERLAAELPPGWRLGMFGSLASDDAWPVYADVDLLVCAPAAPDPADFLRVSEAWRRALPGLLAVDPVQHHGPYVLFECDRALFWPSLLPAEALAGATMLDGAPLDLEVFPIEDHVVSIDALVAAAAGWRRMAGRPRVAGDRYSAKLLGSILLLVPALLYASLGEPMGKGEAIERFKSGAPPDAREAMERVEGWRRSWPGALGLPSPLAHAAGSRAPWLARQFNRIPSPDLARRTEAACGLAARPLFRYAFDRLAAEVPS